MRNKYFFIFFIFLSFKFIEASDKDNYQWKQIKINGGGFINIVLIDNKNPNIIYAGSDIGGIYKSFDYGETWNPYNIGLTWARDNLVAGLAFDSSSNLFLGTGRFGKKGGLFKKTSDKNPWQILSRKIKFNFEIQRIGKNLISIDSRNSQIIYAGSWEDGIFKSIDGGNNWSNTNFKEKYISSILIDSKNSSIIYISCMKYNEIKGGIYKSIDAGKNWTLISPDNIDDVYQLAIVPDNTNIIYASCGNEGIFKSIDNGKTWEAKNSGLEFGKLSNLKLKDVKILSMAIDPNNPKILFAGSGFTHGQIYKSIDEGENWINLTYNKQNIHLDNWWINEINFPGGDNYACTCISIDYTNGNKIFISGRSGIWRSDDGGKNWHPKVNGLEVTCMNQIAFDPKKSDIFFIGNTDWSIFKTINSGKSFQRTLKGIGGWDIDFDKNIWRKYHIKNGRSFAIDPRTEPSTVYFGGNATGKNNGAIFKSIDGGESWTEANGGLPQASITALAINPDNFDKLFTAIQENGLYKTDNAGKNWEKINIKVNLENKKMFASNNNYILISNISSNIIYILDKGNGIYKSIDGGNNWEIISNNLPEQGIKRMDQFVGGLALDNKNPDIAYVGLYKYGIYKTENGGKTWNKITPPHIINGGAITIDKNFNSIYIVSVPGVDDQDIEEFIPGIYKSADNGKTWLPIHNSDLLNISLKITSLNIDPFNKDKIYLTTQGNGIIMGEQKN